MGEDAPFRPLTGTAKVRGGGHDTGRRLDGSGSKVTARVQMTPWKTCDRIMAEISDR
jgi:hypothetical protein